MNTHYILFHDKFSQENFPKIQLNICFLELSEEFTWDPEWEFEPATISELSMFELLKF